MRILTLTNLYPPHYLGGYELICGTVCEALRARGHTVRVLTSDYQREAVEEGREKFVERSLGIHGFYGRPWLGIRQLQRLEEHNNRVLHRALDKAQPDVVYVCNMGGLSKSMLFTLRRRNIPTALYLSDHWIARGVKTDVWLRWWNRIDATWSGRLLRWWWTVTGKRARWDDIAPTDSPMSMRFQRIYFCSAALRDLTQAAGFDVSRGSVIYCPVDTGRFNGPPKTAQEPYQRLLYVGRLAEDKGVLTALRALSLLRGKFSGSLDIFGRGDPDYEAVLRRFAAEAGAPVNFKAASADGMAEVYRAHDGLLFTSEWKEPFALTPLEAMASGLPVIGTTTGGSAELFEHKRNALTYEAANAEQLAQRIMQFANDGALRERCARQGQLDVRERCNESRIVDQIENFLRETVEQWPAKQPVTV